MVDPRKLASRLKRPISRDRVEIRTFPRIDDYWRDAEERRRSSIPHSDGSFFSDGSGYSNGPVADLRSEIVQRLREVIGRLESIDPALLMPADTAPRANSDFRITQDDIDDALTISRAGLEEMGSSEVGKPVLEKWKDTFSSISEKFLRSSLYYCGKYTDTAITEAAKTFGSSVGKAGGIAAVLYVCGVDFHGISSAITTLIQKL